MGRMKFTQAQLDAIKELLPLYELNVEYLKDDLIILDSRAHGDPISVQVRLINRRRTYVCARIRDLKRYYDQIRLDHPKLSLPKRYKSEQEKYMDTH